jgi:hypothetical protein
MINPTETLNMSTPPSILTESEHVEWYGDLHEHHDYSLLIL